MSKTKGKIKLLCHNVTNSLDLCCKIEDIMKEQEKSIGINPIPYTYSITIQIEGIKHTHSCKVIR